MIKEALYSDSQHLISVTFLYFDNLSLCTVCWSGWSCTNPQDWQRISGRKWCKPARSTISTFSTGKSHFYWLPVIFKLRRKKRNHIPLPNVLLSAADPGCLSRILDSDFYLSRVEIQTDSTNFSWPFITISFTLDYYPAFCCDADPES